MAILAKQRNVISNRSLPYSDMQKYANSLDETRQMRLRADKNEKK